LAASVCGAQTGFPFSENEYGFLIRVKLVKEYGSKPGFDVGAPPMHPANHAS
jgi:hypothetical protein